MYNKPAFEECVKQINWHYAKSYASFAPHEYFLDDEYPEHYKMMEMLIAKFGINEPWTFNGRSRMYRYFYTNTHRYWIIEEVVNRCEKDQRRVVKY